MRRYCTKAALHDVHQKSEPFLKFKQETTEMDCYVSKSGFGAFETGIGHMQR